MARLNHLVHIEKEEPVVERIFLLVFGRQRRVRVRNAYELHIVMLRQRRKKTLHVPMLKAYDRHPQPCRLLLGLGQHRARHGEQQRK